MSASSGGDLPPRATQDRIESRPGGRARQAYGASQREEVLLAPSPHKTTEDRLLPIWLALGLVLALFVGTGAGVLGWLSGQVVAAAVLTGGTAFGGTTSLIVLVITLLRPARSAE